MATQGEIKTNVTYESHFWVRWSQKSQDTSKNETVINWSCGVTPGHKFGDNAIKMSAVTINGVKVYNGGTYSDFLDYKEHTLGSGTLVIPHNEDGTKTLTVSSFTGWLYKNNNYSSNGGSFSLTPIPRQARITATADFTDVGNPSITFSNPGGFTMDVWIEPNPVSDHLCVRENIPNTGSYTWVLTDEEREALRNKCAGTECTIRLGLYTHIGNTTYADYKDKKFTMTENAATKPAVSLSVVLNNTLIPNKFSGLYIQGKSRVYVEVSADGKYGADIKSYSAKIQGDNFEQSYNVNRFNSDVIDSSGSVKIYGYAKDSRTFTGSAEQEIDVIPYSKPKISDTAACYRSDGNGKRVGSSTSLWIKADRSYHTVEGKNTCALQWRWKLSSDDWGNTWKDLLTASNTANVYDGLVQGVEFSPSESYTVQVRAIDDIGEYSIKTFDVPTLDVALHLGKGGKNVTIGTYCDYAEERTFRSAWKAIFDLDINGLYIRTVDVSGTDHIYIKTKYDDFDGTGENRQSFFIFGTANLIPLNGTGLVASDGNTDWVGTTSVGLTPLDGGVLQVTLPSVSHDAFAVISSSPFEIVYL